MATQASKSRRLLFTAWGFLLLASGLPRIILQDVFGMKLHSNYPRFSGDWFSHARRRIK